MNLILFVHQDSSGEGSSFKKVIEENFTEHQVESFQTFREFKRRLKQVYLYETEIYILLADSTNRLNELTELIDLLEDRRIILILPDDSETTISSAHRFFPRFFTYLNDKYDDLCCVLNKMINSKNTNIY